MTAQLFSDLVATNQIPTNIASRVDASRDWLRTQAQRVRNVDPLVQIRKGTSNLQNVVMVGSMYMFFYDPKTKDQLPFYDRFPLIFPFRKVPGGFLGLNMHYLPYMLRAKLMNQLYTLANNTMYDETTRLRLSYKMLSSSARFQFFQPCVKHYLNSHVKSRFLYIHPKEWDVALFLPTERFVKQNKQQVFNHSRQMLGR